MRESVGILRSRRTRLGIALVVVVTLASAFCYVRATQVMPQRAIFLLSDVRLPRAGQRVLVFSPHPDDETIGAGGYIRRCCDRGARVRIVLVTDGNKHNLEPRRYAEFKKATWILGVPGDDLVFLGYPDGKMRKQSRSELRRVFAEQIVRFSPDVVVYPHRFDNHPDHAVVGDVMDAVLARMNPEPASYQFLVHHSRFPQPKRLRQGMYVLPPVSLVSFDREWRRLMLPERVEGDKLQAVRCYRTQLRVPLLRSLLLSCVRRNELFSVSGEDDP